MRLTDKREYFQPFAYPQAFSYLKRQEQIFWNAHEIQTARDVHQFYTEFTEAEKHMITTILRLFTQYELNVGCFWSDFVAKKFGGHWEVASMAKMFSSMENIHALFYNKLNEGLGLNTPEFFESYKSIDALLKNVEITEVNTRKSIDKSLLEFSFVEGVKLFGSFAVLLNFPRYGKLRGVENGLKYSIFDEQLHCAASCWLYKTYCEEQNIKPNQKYAHQAATRFVEHEQELVEILFAKGDIEGLIKEDVFKFIEHRADVVLGQLGYEMLYNSKSQLQDWFYLVLNAQEDTDFFVSKATEYTQGWDFGGIEKW